MEHWIALDRLVDVLVGYQFSEYTTKYIIRFVQDDYKLEVNISDRNAELSYKEKFYKYSFVTGSVNNRAMSNKEIWNKLYSIKDNEYVTTKDDPQKISLAVTEINQPTEKRKVAKLSINIEGFDKMLFEFKFDIQ